MESAHASSVRCLQLEISRDVRLPQLLAMVAIVLPMRLEHLLNRNVCNNGHLKHMVSHSCMVTRYF